MSKNYLLVLFCLLISSISCSQQKEVLVNVSDGSITYTLSNASAINGKTLYLGLFNQSETVLDTSTVLYTKTIIINSGTMVTVFSDNTGATVKFKGGNTYKIRGYIDIDENGSMNMGDKLISIDNITIDGDKSISNDYNSLLNL